MESDTPSKIVAWLITTLHHKFEVFYETGPFTIYAVKTSLAFMKGLDARLVIFYTTVNLDPLEQQCNDPKDISRGTQRVDLKNKTDQDTVLVMNIFCLPSVA